MTPAPKPLPWSDVPEAEKKRLQEREKVHRRETKDAGLPALPCPPEGMWLLQGGCCNCPDCVGRQIPLNPFATWPDDDAIVVAHEYFRKGINSPGHVPGNVWLWFNRCNRKFAGKEKTGKASQDKHAAFRSKMLSTQTEREEKKQKRKKQWQSRPMNQKPSPNFKPTPVKDINA